MSNNRNSSNSQRLTSEQRLKKEKMLLQMKKEINSLERDANHLKIANFKIGVVRDLKISARAFQFIAPFILTAGVTTSVFTFLGITPFYNGDKWKVNPNVRTEFDSDGKIRYEEKYDEKFENEKSELYYYSKWQEEDGLYSRVVQKYSIKNKTYEDIIKLFSLEDVELEKILGSPITTTESKNYLTNEELQEGAHFKSVIYSKNENKYVIHEETVEENVLTTILFILLTLLCEIVPYKYRTDISNFDFSACVEKIKAMHPYVNEEELVKRLEIKRNNYNRLMR